MAPEDRRSQSETGGTHHNPPRNTNRSVIVTLTDAGDLVWSGQDLWPEVATLHGGSMDYEWSRTVPAAYVPALLAALGGRPGENVVALVAASFETDVELEAFATKAGIPTEFDSWISSADAD